jgi:hypothetical protein
LGLLVGEDGLGIHLVLLRWRLSASATSTRRMASSRPLRHTPLHPRSRIQQPAQLLYRRNRGLLQNRTQFHCRGGSPKGQRKKHNRLQPNRSQWTRSKASSWPSQWHLGALATTTIRNGACLEAPGESTHNVSPAEETEPHPSRRGALTRRKPRGGGLYGASLLLVLG